MHRHVSGCLHQIHVSPWGIPKPHCSRPDCAKDSRDLPPACFSLLVFPPPSFFPFFYSEPATCSNYLLPPKDFLSRGGSEQLCALPKSPCGPPRLKSPRLPAQPSSPCSVVLAAKKDNRRDPPRGILHCSP